MIFKLNKKNKAQIAIEYIIFLAIFLLFFQAVIYPNITFAENVVKDVSDLTYTKRSIDSLASTVEQFSNSLGYGQRSIYFYLPSSSTLLDCNNITKTIEYDVKISDQKPKPKIQNCDPITNICFFKKELSIGNSNINCNRLGPGYNGFLIIEKDDATGDIDVHT
jgi:uncharacterized protein (UPF0333 family)